MITSQKTKCPLCNGKANLQQDNFTGYQADMIFEIYLCDNCHTSFPLPQMNASKIYDFIYKNGENIPGYSRYWDYFKKIKKQENPLSFLANSEESYWGIQKALAEITNERTGLKILEIGCGLGYLTYALRSENYDVLGLDISKEAIENAKKNFGNYFICADLFKYVETNSGTFDIIIFTELIEHIEQPMEFFEVILELLTVKGKVILTTPNRSISPNDIIWDTESPPVHHWWFSENSMNYIAKHFNLNLDFISFEEYYKKYPQEYRAKKARKNVFHEPVINENWELYGHQIPRKKGKLKLLFKAFLSRFKFLKRPIFNLKAYFDPSIIICGERGIVLCAVFQKN